MDRWFLKDGVVCFKSEDAEINGWSLAGLVACLNKRDKTIADLEAKLAVADDCADRYWNQLAVEQNYIKQLKQQLAEKDQAIEGLKDINKSLGQTCNNDAKEIEFLQKTLEELGKEKDELISKYRYWQTECFMTKNKTAIAELEKVRTFFEPYENSEKDTILCANNGISFLEYIDQQIKSLKGETKC